MDFAFNLAGKLVWLALKPQNWLVVLVVLTALCLWAGRVRAARRLGTASALVLLGFAILPVGDWALGTLERRYSPNPDVSGAQGIIVLGGAVDIAGTLRHDQVQLTWGGERMTTTVALARRYPDLPVVFTGGSGALRDMGRQASESQVAARFFDEMGLDLARVTLEPDARNTTENARRSALLVDASQRWILITSASHLPRAVASFGRAGWSDLIPYPVDFNARPVALGWDFILQMDLLSIALREYLGQLAYWAAGR